MFILTSLIILSIISSFTNLILNKNGNPSMLYCGLVGYCGKSKPDYSKLKILGLYNESRGEDSTGVYMSGEVTKIAGYHGKFSNYIRNNKFPKIKGECNSVIIHTRKASVGGVTEKNAHPFILSSGERQIIFAHNGTLENWKELQDKYNINKALDTDSKILGAAIVKENNFKVINEYIGAAAFLLYTTGKTNTLTLFKGAAGNVEERPLYYMQVRDSKKNIKGVYISSMNEALEAINDDDSEIVKVPNNALITFENGIIKEELTIVRPAELKKNYTYSRNSAVGYYYPNRNNYNSGVQVGSTTSNMFPTTKINPNLYSGKSFKGVNYEEFVKESDFSYVKKRQIHFKNFRYYITDTPLDGGCIINKETFKAPCIGIKKRSRLEKALLKESKKSDKLVSGWFCKGILAKDYASYIALKDLLNEASGYSEASKILKKVDAHRLSKHSTHPVSNSVFPYANRRNSYVYAGLLYSNGELIDFMVYKNDFSPLEYTITSGKVVSKIKLNKNIVPFESDNDEKLMKDYVKRAMTVLSNYSSLKRAKHIQTHYAKVYEFVRDNTRSAWLEDSELELLMELEEEYES